MSGRTFGLVIGGIVFYCVLNLWPAAGAEKEVFADRQALGLSPQCAQYCVYHCVQLLGTWARNSRYW